MKRVLSALTCLATLGLVLAGLTPMNLLRGQEATETAKTTPLGVRQQRVERMLEDLESKFKTLAQALQKTEPARAEKLLKTLNEAKSLGMQARMAQITRMLNDAKLGEAKGEQQKMLADMKKLLELLLDDDKKDKLEEFDRLSKWKEDLQNIIKEEKAQEQDSDKIANKDDTLAKLAKQIKAVEKLIKDQEGVISKTTEARNKATPNLGPVADAQRGVRKDTEAAASDISGKPAGDGKQSDSGKEGSSKEGAGKEGNNQEGMNPEGAGKEGAGKEGSGKEGSGKEGAGKEGSGKEGSGKEGSGKEGGGKEGSQGGESGGQSGGESGGKQGGDQKSTQPDNPTAQALERAAQHQKAAEDNLQQGKGKAAEHEEKQALEDLKSALEKLKKEEARIAKLPPDELDKMADKQDDTANKTAKLGDEMKKSGGQQGGGEGGEGGQQGGEGGEGGEGGQKKPGQKNVQQAKQSMERASGDLRKKDPAEANKAQRKAIKELEEAIQEIEERLAQLREETQMEKLARLEARFMEMLQRQQTATLATTELEKKKSANSELTRIEKLQIGKLAQEEFKLSEMAQQALDIIVEDGTSVVFPEVVTQVRDDLTSVAQMLEGQRVDALTVSVQQDIEATLKELIEALQKAQQQKKEGMMMGGGGGMGGDEPLLPNSAELKLLRSMQVRVNNRTVAIDKTRPKEGDLDPVLQKEIDGVSKRQQEIADLTQEIIERTR